MKNMILNSIVVAAAAINFFGQHKYEKDMIDTSSGKLSMEFIGHSSLMFDLNGKVIHVDPVANFGDYGKLPKADIILITHHHPDHMDTSLINRLTKKNTQIILNQTVFDILKKGIVMKNGDKQNVEGIEIEAVPAYNTTVGREQFHPKGRDNGYVLTFGNKRIYIAGDTEDIPEMASLKNIDIAFLPMNQPYTMTPEQVANAVKKFNPKILYPYHYGDTDVSKLQKLLASNKNIEIRVRLLK
jgi:L-ascorbate metabolism protein UlaG (beta-lactamase superfamily)